VGKFTKLYKTRMWQRIREARLNEEPLCRMCKADGVITPAEVVDHVKRHHGCWQRFADYENTQSLCKRHHDSDKQSQEWFEALPDRAGLDGYPTDGSW
jgi:hypothetical protein